MDWIKQLAPLIGTALAGPFGGVAAKMLADKVGLSDSSVKAVQDVIANSSLTADNIAQIKIAEIEFEKFCKTNSIDLEKLAVEDRKGAREMLISTRSWVPAALTIFTTTGFFGVLVLMMLHPDVKESAPLMIMLGQLSAGWAACLAFWMGTTSSSQNKTNLLAQSAPVR
jgi:hypothetical protein